MAQLSAPTAAMSLPTVSSHRFDPSDGLDATEVAMLAIANNPDLKVQRDALGIARAQAFAAGLLPDPQISISGNVPRGSGPGLTKGYSLGISEDLSALLTRSSRKAAARNEVDRVNLDLLWAEWQTVAQARLLFDQVLILSEQQTRLEAEQDALTQVEKYVRMALQAGNLTYDAASAGLNAFADVSKQLATNTIALNKARTDLRSLLGLAATAPLQLTGPLWRPQPTSAQVQAALTELPQRRPDLLALQAGYRSQEATVRAAILAQFPALNIGFNTARDTGNITSDGFTLGITLPLFDRNRGNIAIARATRQQLRDTYASRMLTTRSDMQRILADLNTLQRERQQLTAHTRELDTALKHAEKAWDEGLLNWPIYLAIRSSALLADLDLLAVEQEYAKQAIALQTLLGNTHIAPSHPPSAKARMP
ncbi:MAG: TolC family protein [Rhodanobacter sp.]